MNNIIKDITENQEFSRTVDPYEICLFKNIKSPNLKIIDKTIFYNIKPIKSNDIFRVTHGQKVKVKINNNELDAVIAIEDNTIFICQNMYKNTAFGSSEKFGKKYSYIPDDALKIIINDKEYYELGIMSRRAGFTKNELININDKIYESQLF